MAAATKKTAAKSGKKVPPKKGGGRTPSKAKQQQIRERNSYATGIILCLVGVVLGVFVYTSATGIVGNAVRSFFSGILGLGATFLPLAVFGLGVYIMVKKNMKSLCVKSILITLTLIALCALIAQFGTRGGIPDALWDYYIKGAAGEGGGLIGGCIYAGLSGIIGNIATAIILIVLIIVLLSFCTHFSAFQFFAGLWRGWSDSREEMHVDYEGSYEKGRKVGQTASQKTPPRRIKSVDIPLDDEEDHARAQIPKDNHEAKRKLDQTFQEIKKNDEELKNCIENFPVYGLGSEKSKENQPKPYGGELKKEPVEEFEGEEQEDILEVTFDNLASEFKSDAFLEGIIQSGKGKQKASQTLTQEVPKASSPVYAQSDEEKIGTEFKIVDQADDDEAPFDLAEEETPLQTISRPIPKTQAEKLNFPPAPGIVEPKESERNVNVEIIDQLKLEEEGGIPPKPSLLPYTYPNLSLLDMPQVNKNASYEEEIRQNVVKLVDTLASFGVQVTPLQASRGPSVTRYELQPGRGVKVNKITGLADDIALNLAATAVRIEAPIPGKAAIGIEIPNKNVSIVSLREVIDSKEFQESKSKLSVALGMDIAGNPVVGDIGKMPHVLIAGATGSGKSVCINTLITSLIYKSDPNEVKFIMIDPKVVELGIYNGIPHLLVPVVTDPGKAAGALNWAVTEMVRRYGLFAENNVRDLKGYNRYIEEKFGKEYRMPNIVIIIDELADLMMVAPNDVEDSICRLAQMARAAGMHLVIATQRPSVDVITGIIKANIPSRIAFAVSSQVDSRTILDMVGAEKLLGKGDMLYYPSGASKPKRLQGAFVSDQEIESIVEFIKNSSETAYDEDIAESMENVVLNNGKKQKSDSSEEDEVDELLNEAIEIAVDLGQISTSFIQRRLKVGYARAGRLIDQMHERGIISGFDGSKPRNVLITKEQWRQMNQ